MLKNKTKKLTLTAMFIALALVLPFLTAQVPSIGQMLTPMHFPVIIGAIFLGPFYGAIIGVVSPLLRFLLFSLPPFPMALTMTFELATYGLVVGFIFYFLNKKNINYILSLFIAMIIGMVLGRLVYAGGAMLFLEATNYFKVFLVTFSGSFIGIIFQLVLIPTLAIRLKKYVEAT